MKPISLPPNLFFLHPVAILFSGGDAPGMNPFLRAFVRMRRAPVLGIMDGYAGLLRAARRVPDERSLRLLQQQILRYPGIHGLDVRKQDIVLLDDACVSGLAVAGGIRLRTSRFPAFATPETRAEAAAMLRRLGIKTLVVGGGNGSLEGARLLHEEHGIRVIGIPCTIDNDMDATELALGVSTAVSNIVRAVIRIKDTARAHRRLMVLETMGRKCGQITLDAAIASGAEHAIIPEDGVLTDKHVAGLGAALADSFSRGRSHSIVLVAEGVELENQRHASPAMDLAERLKTLLVTGQGSDVEIRTTILGHLQRGGPPVAQDGLLAAEFAEAAWDVISGGSESGVISRQGVAVKRVAFSAARGAGRAQRIKAMHERQKALSHWGQSALAERDQPAIHVLKRAA